MDVDSTASKSRLVTGGRKLVKWLSRGVLLLVGVLLLGMLPVNNDYSATPDGVEIFVTSNAVHADIIMPATNDIMDWRGFYSDAAFRGDVDPYTHVAIGWGDRGFFLKTRTWDDFKLSTAANAMFLPSESCIHVNYTNPEFHAGRAEVSITEDEYRDLVAFIKSSHVHSEQGKPVQIDGFAYWQTDAFFAALGTYHLLNTCNSWVGRGLDTADVRVPWLSPLPKTPLLYLPRSQ